MGSQGFGKYCAKVIGYDKSTYAQVCAHTSQKGRLVRDSFFANSDIHRYAFNGKAIKIEHENELTAR